MPGVNVATRGDVRGAGLAILVNANAKRGGRRVAVQIAKVLPGAQVRLTKTIDELVAWLRTLKNPDCVLAAGGDGTAIALVNALDRVTPEGEPFPHIGVLPLGTGNAWAHATGARKLDQALRLLARPRVASHVSPAELPTRKYGLVDCEGTLTHFAGSGWDAQILDDYKSQLAASKGPAYRVHKTAYGYVSATLLRTAPKTILFGRPHVILENLGDEVYTITADRKLLKLAGVKRGDILYEGMASVAAASTCPEFGYGFRAFPFAERMLGMINVRIYDRSAPAAVATIPKLWRGHHPLRGMHDWFATAVRMTFSRPVPLQIGGDAVGMRQTIDFRCAPRDVAMLDWRRMD
ncbi:MAG TPA: diacylglycerol kinase family protein [Polyangiaceae bacterium]|jgi:diacylglycerol kinase family enzyme